jgi:hypothetical protein
MLALKSQYSSLFVLISSLCRLPSRIPIQIGMTCFSI